MRYAICDDEPLFLAQLADAVRSASGEPQPELCLFSEPQALLDAAAGGADFDAVFLDIEMPGMDGLTAARQLRQTLPAVPLLFFTSHTELAPEGYEVNAFRFLRKPLEPEKLRAALHDLAQRSRVRMVSIRESGSEYLLDPAAVLYLQSDNNDVLFVTAERTYRSRMKLSAAETLVQEAAGDFVKIHRCIIVNLRHVQSYQADGVTVTGGELLPLSRKTAAAFRSEMLRFIREQAR